MEKNKILYTEEMGKSMASFNLKIKGFNESKEKPIDFILSNDEIKKFAVIYNAENSKNANHSTDNRILKICCSIDRIMEQDATNKNIKDANGQLIYGKTRMHLLRRWSKQKYVDNPTNGWNFFGNIFYDEYYKDIVISFIHGGLEVRKVEFCMASLDFYEETTSSDGLDNIMILRVKQIENQKSDIVFDDHSLLIGQKRYIGTETAEILGKNGLSTGNTIPRNAEVTLLGSKKILNRLTVIEVSYIDANGNKQNIFVNCTDLRNSLMPVSKPLEIPPKSNDDENNMNQPSNGQTNGNKNLELTVPIKESYLPADRYQHGQQQVKMLVLHDTGNIQGDAAKGNFNYFITNEEARTKGFTAHAFIDDIELLKTLPNNQKAWHVRGRYEGREFNTESYGLELCNLLTQEKVDEQFINAAKYYASLCIKYNLSISDIYSHGELTTLGNVSGGHMDPHAYLAKWGYNMDKFRVLVASYL